jgi:hypothetical protein
VDCSSRPSSSARSCAARRHRPAGPSRATSPHDGPPTRTYAVQPGRGKPAACRIEILDVRQELVGQITFDDARAEGFRTTAEFSAAWVRIHDKAWVAAWNGTEDEHDLTVRFTERHAQKPVWVITFKLDHAHVPRLLAARPAPDYVTDPRLALPGEPEALSDEDWKRHVEAHRDRNAAEWQTVEEHQRELDRRLMSQDERIARMRREANMRGVDITRELWLLNKRLPTLAGDSLERHTIGGPRWLQTSRWTRGVSPSCPQIRPSSTSSSA